MSLPPVSSSTQPSTALQAKAVAQNANAKNAKPKQGGDEFSFMDFLDIVNPLQHIPIVSTIYRNVTGDTIKNPARIIGGAVFGGFFGAAMGGINAMAVNETGKDIGEMALNKVGFGKKEENVKVAENVSVNKDIPVVEVNALPKKDQPAGTTAWRLSDIVWDDAKTASLPKAKSLNDLEPVAGLSDAESLNAIEPGTKADAPIAPVAKAEISNTMMMALDKYKAMQVVSDSTVKNESADKELKTRRPFASMTNLRQY